MIFRDAYLRRRPDDLEGRCAFPKPGCKLGEGSSLCYRQVLFHENPFEAVGKHAVIHYPSSVYVGVFFGREVEAHLYIEEATRRADWSGFSLDNPPPAELIESLAEFARELMDRKAYTIEDDSLYGYLRDALAGKDEYVYIRKPAHRRRYAEELAQFAHEFGYEAERRTWNYFIVGTGTIRITQFKKHRVKIITKRRHRQEKVR